MALPTDQLEAMLDRYDKFGIGQCQCRIAMRTVGRGCDAPLSNCVAMGEWAEAGVEAGWLKSATAKEVLEVKREAEAAGLVNWMMNIESTRGQASCSCCKCCCHALRTVSEYNVPGLFAPPHFVPRFDYQKCTYCGRCAKQCPTGAIAVDPGAKTHEHLRERCIGCGLCVAACGRAAAATMEPVDRPPRPYSGWLSFMAGAMPGVVRNVWNVWRTRR